MKPADSNREVTPTWGPQVDVNLEIIWVYHQKMKMWRKWTIPGRKQPRPAFWITRLSRFKKNEKTYSRFGDSYTTFNSRATEHVFFSPVKWCKAFRKLGRFRNARRPVLHSLKVFYLFSGIITVATHLRHWNKNLNSHRMSS